MIFYQTIEYCDADGNRGVSVWNHQHEPEDEEHIRQYVIENMPEYFDGCGEDVVDVPFINPITDEEVCIEITLKEWI